MTQKQSPWAVGAQQVDRQFTPRIQTPTFAHSDVQVVAEEVAYTGFFTFNLEN